MDIKSVVNDDIDIVTWLELLANSDSDERIQTAAREIAFELKGNLNIGPKPSYEPLYLKYGFKIKVIDTQDGLRAALYYYDGEIETFIKLIEPYANRDRSIFVELQPTPTPTPTVTPSITPSGVTPSVTPSFTPTPSIPPTNSVTPSFTPTNSVPFTPTVTATPTITPSKTVTPTASPPAPTRTPTPSITPTPTITPSPDPYLIYFGAGTPEMYGAVGDGVTDDYIAIKKAFLSHSVIQFGAKTYAMRGRMGVPSYRKIVGVGKDKTTIKLMDNSPYGYSDQCVIFQNTFMSNTPQWYKYNVFDADWYTGGPNGVTLGSGSVNDDTYGGVITDVFVIDKATDSPNYNLPQLDISYNKVAPPYGGLGYFPNDGLEGLRKNILIKDLTVDCNFNKQAKHKSYNWKGNYNFRGSSYIPELSGSVRTTICAFNLVGEDITIDNVRVVNYGYGVSGLNTGSFPSPYSPSTINPSQEKINYNNRVPRYIEEFVISVNGSNAKITMSGSRPEFVDRTDRELTSVTEPLRPTRGFSRLFANFVKGSEILQCGNVDLMNPYSNATAIVCTNATALSDGKSSYPTEGGIYNCYVNPGYLTQSVEASFYNGRALDEHMHSDLKKTAGNLFEWLTGSLGKVTGSNGSYAVSKGKITYIKKISGSWVPNTGLNRLQFRHIVQAFTGMNVVNSRAENVKIGVYNDSYNSSYIIENNQFVNVENGININCGVRELTPNYDNVIIKNNYIKLVEHLRPTTTIYRAYYPTEQLDDQGIGIQILADPGKAETDSSNTGFLDVDYHKTSWINKLIVENNIIEIPVSSSRKLYLGKGAPYETTTNTPYPFYKYDGYSAGVQIPGDLTLDRRGRESPFTRYVSIKDNRFINFYPSMSYYNGLIQGNFTNPFRILTFLTASKDNQSVNFSGSRDYYKNVVLPRYNFQNNTYNSPLIPSTSSLAPVSVNIWPNKFLPSYVEPYYYPIKQSSLFGNLKVSTNVSVAGNLYANTKSFLIDHPTKPGKKLQYGSLESPYHGIRLTGKTKANKNIVKVDLPNYIRNFVDEENINIQISPYLCNKIFSVEKIDIQNNCFYVFCEEVNEKCEFFWTFTATRKDVDKLITEI